MGDTKPPCKMGKATLELPGGRVSQIWGDTPLLLCQDERPRTSQVLMRHAWRDRAYPGTCEAVLASPACLSVPAQQVSFCSLGDMQRTASLPPSLAVRPHQRHAAPGLLTEAMVSRFPHGWALVVAIAWHRQASVVSLFLFAAICRMIGGLVHTIVRGRGVPRDMTVVSPRSMFGAKAHHGVPGMP
jgi:hypothetical protein